MAQGEPFDVSALLSAPLQMVGVAATVLEAGKQSVTAMVDTVASLQRSAHALEELLTRINGIVDTIEGPARVLAPEMERLASRLSKLNVMDDLPDTLGQLNDRVLQVVSGLGDLPKRVGPIADLLGGAAGLFGLGGRPSETARPVEPPVEPPVAPPVDRPKPVKAAKSAKAPARSRSSRPQSAS
jgi:hypothetical protein